MKSCLSFFLQLICPVAFVVAVAFSFTGHQSPQLSAQHRIAGLSLSPLKTALTPPPGNSLVVKHSGAQARKPKVHKLSLSHIGQPATTASVSGFNP